MQTDLREKPQHSPALIEKLKNLAGVSCGEFLVRKLVSYTGVFRDTRQLQGRWSVSLCPSGKL